MKLLLINPNTTEAVTARLAGIARGCAPDGATVVGATGRFGARYVASRASAAIAAHALLDLLAERIGSTNPEGFDRVILGCFGDPGLAAAREVCPVPVIGLAEAAFAAAAAQADRFAVVTAGRTWIPMVHELAALQGLSARLVAVYALRETGLDVLQGGRSIAPEIAALIRRSAEESGAGAVILGGAGLAGLVHELAAHAPVPLIDPVRAAIGMATRETARRGEPAPHATHSDGLSPALARLLAAG